MLNNVENYISDEDKIKYGDYLQYLKCQKCGKLVNDEFKLCTSCKEITCNKCKCIIEGHEISQPRHIRFLLERMKFKCSFCLREDLLYFELNKHCSQCYSSQKQKETKINFDFNCIYCNVCHSKINTKKEYLQHIKKCTTVEGDHIVKFIKYKDELSLKLNKFIENSNNDFNNCIKEYVHSNLLLNKDTIQYSKFDEYYIQLLSQEKELILQKTQLEKQLAFSLKSLQEYLQLQGNDLVLPSNSAINKENNSLLEYIIRSNEPNEQNLLSCGYCGEYISYYTSKYCQECAACFCKDKCALKCAGKLCNNYLCPKDKKPCSLCGDKIYCNKCLVHCFNNKCQNEFCSHCYSKNKHQKRENGESCHLIHCELCNKEMCIMASINLDHSDWRTCVDCYKTKKNEKKENNRKRGKLTM